MESRPPTAEAGPAAAARARRSQRAESIERRSSRSSRRKSGPKYVDVETSREEGREERRRMSGTQRRNSKSRAAAMRRERSELRPPVTGQRGIGRASLPARLTAPMMVANDGPAEPTPNPPGDEARRAAVGADHDSSVEAMQVEEAGQKKDKQTNRSKENDDATWTPEMLEKAAREILGDDKQLQFRSVRWLRIVLSLSEKPPAGEAVAAGLVPQFLRLLQDKDHPEARHEALCALTNIASTEYSKAVALEPGAIPTLKALLTSPDLYLREQSAWCLGNIAGDCVELRDIVLGAGVMEALLDGLSPSRGGSSSFMRTGVWTLNNLCRGTPPPSLSTVVPALPVIAPVMAAANSGDTGALIDAGWVLYHITRGGTDRIDAVLSSGLLSSLPDLLLHEKSQVVRPVLRAMDNLACSSGPHRGALIAAGVLEPLMETLGHDSSKVRADALRLLSCIAAGSPDQVAAVASTGDMIPSVMAELEEGNSLCRREAGWVFLNMCECGVDVGESIIPDIVSHGVISAICHNLDDDAEPESLVVMLSLLFTILDEGGQAASGAKLLEYIALVEESDGFDRIMGLMNDHDDMDVYDKAVVIIRYFADKNDGDDYGDDDEDDIAAGSDFDDDDSVAGSGAGAIMPSGRNVNRVNRMSDDNDDENEGYDSLSDDSFHPELGGTEGPITPPHLTKNLSPVLIPRTNHGTPMLPTNGAKRERGSAAAIAVTPPAHDTSGSGKAQRQPLGAVSDPSVRGGNVARHGVWDMEGGGSMTGKGRLFRESETGNTK